MKAAQFASNVPDSCKNANDGLTFTVARNRFDTRLTFYALHEQNIAIFRNLRQQSYASPGPRRSDDGATLTNLANA
jgi:hypothetical protein